MTERADAMAGRRADFPLLRQTVDGRPVVYLDSAATTLKPQAVIDAVMRVYTEQTANVHRAVHRLSEVATEAYEGARESVARFIGADYREVAFVRNATEAINVVAHSYRDAGVVAMPLCEHHSNLVPWRENETLVLPLRADGAVDLESSRRLIAERRPGLVTLSTVNNVMGVRLPVAELIVAAREVGSAVLLDVSQSVGHEPFEVGEWDCDFACFSGHKMLGPSGVGVLYQREGASRPVRPLLTGGAMIQAVHAEGHEFQVFPWCIEAGTPNIEGVIGLGAACEYLEDIGLSEILAHTRDLVGQARAGLGAIEGVAFVGPADLAADSIVAFRVAGMAAHGVARQLSNRFALMVRSGYLCAQPLHEACGFPESVRASFHLYNTAEEVEALAAAVKVVAGAG